MTAIFIPVGSCADRRGTRDAPKSRDVNTSANTCQDTEGQALNTCARLPAQASVPPVRILIDYRPALRQRTGVGEYVHQLARALAEQRVDRSVERRAATAGLARTPTRGGLHEFLEGPAVARRRRRPRAGASGWSTDESRSAGSTPHGTALGWPPVEWLTGRTLRRRPLPRTPAPALDARAAGLVTIHDLDFLAHPGADARRNAARLPGARRPARRGRRRHHRRLGACRREGQPSCCASTPSASASARTASRAGRRPASNRAGKPGGPLHPLPRHARTSQERRRPAGGVRAT